MGTDMKTKLERIPLEVFNQGNFGLIDELIAPDFVEHYAQPGVPPTREGFKQFAMAYRSAFPDLRYTVEDTIDAGDTIVQRLTASGTMKGDLLASRPAARERPGPRSTSGASTTVSSSSIGFSSISWACSSSSASSRPRPGPRLGLIATDGVW